MYDIGIVGGGIAGMTAAIYGLRAGKRTVMIESTGYWRADYIVFPCGKLSGYHQC